MNHIGRYMAVQDIHNRHETFVAELPLSNCSSSFNITNTNGEQLKKIQVGISNIFCKFQKFSCHLQGNYLTAFLVIITNRKSNSHFTSGKHINILYEKIEKSIREWKCPGKFRMWNNLKQIRRYCRNRSFIFKSNLECPQKQLWNIR